VERSKIPLALLAADDVEVLNRAIEVSGKSHRKFATEVLGRDESTVRRWLAGKPIPGVVKSYLCRIILSQGEKPDAERT
jgi:hypothetical protein